MYIHRFEVFAVFELYRSAIAKHLLVFENCKLRIKSILLLSIKIVHVEQGIHKIHSDKEKWNSATRYIGEHANSWMICKCFFRKYFISPALFNPINDLSVILGLQTKFFDNTHLLIFLFSTTTYPLHHANIHPLNRWNCYIHIQRLVAMREDHATTVSKKISNTTI